MKTVTHKQTAIRFLEYYCKTYPLSFDSTGKNNGLSADELFDKFIKLPEQSDLIPMGYNKELEAAHKEIVQLVKNNNDLKDTVECLQLRPVDLREVAGKAWDAAVNRATDLMMYGKSKATMPDKETYLNSLPSKP